MKTCKNCGLPRPDPGEVMGYSGPICNGIEKPHYFEPLNKEIVPKSWQYPPLPTQQPQAGCNGDFHGINCNHGLGPRR